MRATQVVARGRVEFIEVPAPTLKRGHALVRPMLVAICGSDVHRVYYAAPDQYPAMIGTAGHEMVGVVEAVEAPGYSIQPGDMALTLVPEENAMAELYLAAPEDVLVLPRGWPLDHLLMAQQLGTVIFTCKHLPNIVGKDVVVIGQGSAGLFLDWMCRRLGAGRVIGLDMKQARVNVASKFGATHTIICAHQDPLEAVMEITQRELADLVIEAAGEVDAIRLAPQLVKVGGHLHFFGVPRAQTFEFDFDALFRKYCHTTSVAGTASEPGRSSVGQALAMIVGREIDVAPLLTHRLPFDRVLEGYELARTCEDDAIKVVIEMPAYRSQR